MTEETEEEKKVEEVEEEEEQRHAFSGDYLAFLIFMEKLMICWLNIFRTRAFFWEWREAPIGMLFQTTIWLVI